MFTGLIPPHHGVRDNGGFFLDDAQRHAGRAAAGARATRRAPSSGPGCWSRAGAWPRASTTTPTASSSSKYKVVSLGTVQKPGDEVMDGRARAGSTPCVSASSSPGSTSTTRTRPTSRRSRIASRYPGQPYLGEIAYTDAVVGRLTPGCATQRPAGPHVVVVVTADHGESLGDHGEASHAYFIYGATMHVPLIVRTPWGLTGPQRGARLRRRPDADRARPGGPAARRRASTGARWRARCSIPRRALGHARVLGDLLPPLSLRLAAPAQPARRPLHLHRRAASPSSTTCSADPGETRNVFKANSRARGDAARARWSG